MNYFVLGRLVRELGAPRLLNDAYACTEANMARDSFSTFIPISVESQARAQIIFDFFDLFSAIAAHAKTNGLAGLKLSRLAGWWAFEHLDTGWGFDGGYSSWTRFDLRC